MHFDFTKYISFHVKLYCYNYDLEINSIVYIDSLLGASLINSVCSNNYVIGYKCFRIILSVPLFLSTQF